MDKKQYEAFERLKKIERFTKLCDFLKYVSDNNDGVLKRIELNPESPDAAVLIELETFDIYEDGLRRLSDFLSVASTFRIEASSAGTVLLSVSVKDVWEIDKKDE